MNNEILADALKDVRDMLQKDAHEHCVSVHVTFTSKGYEIIYDLRSPGGLKRSGISMRNLRGDWISD